MYFLADASFFFSSFGIKAFLIVALFRDVVLNSLIIVAHNMIVICLHRQSIFWFFTVLKLQRGFRKHMPSFSLWGEGNAF